MRTPLPALVTFCLLAVSLTAARPVEVSVDAAAPGIAVAPTMHGLFFEDINYAADGGLYAEMVENRSFEHGEALHAWTEAARGGGEGSLELKREDGYAPTNPTYARLAVKYSGGGYGLANSGYGGMAVEAGGGYLAEVRARSDSGLKLVAVLEDASGRELGRAELGAAPTAWGRLEARMVASASAKDARLLLLAAGPGSVDVDVISLFPEATFKGRRNGMRADLAQALLELKPGFLRFPGGCIVEGTDLENAYRWKDTVGDIAVRRQNRNLWSGGRTPQYHQTYGLGFFEYFQLAEDLGAEAVPVVNCGMSCQVRRGPACTPEDLAEWIQDALDLIEFANGPADSKWGAVRASMGREQPFNLRMLGVGNEQWGQTYFDHYLAFHKAIRERHPEILIISSAGTAVDDGNWRAAWEQFRAGVPADIVDEHYYVSPAWMLANSNRYAAYDRSLPKVFVGEFAAHDTGRRATLRSALAEASYMTGLLRNADVVIMSAYAPLLARMGHDQWSPNLIWFDSTRVLRTASFHVQALYGRNRPDRVMPVSVKGVAAAPVARGRVGVGTWNTAAEFKDVRVVAADGRVLLDGSTPAGNADWKPTRGNWTVKDGVLTQTEEAADRVAYAGSDDWTDYTYSLKARKLSGREGFMIHFGGSEGSLGHWNLGGWENTSHGLEVPGLGARLVPGRIETGRWYDIRIEVGRSTIRAFLDGELVQQADLSAVRREPIYVAAGVDERTDEWVFFLANPTGEAIDASIRIGGGDAEHSGIAARMSGRDDDVNTFEDPARLAPLQRRVRIEVSGGVFKREIPASTFEVLRFPRKAR